MIHQVHKDIEGDLMVNKFLLLFLLATNAEAGELAMKDFAAGVSSSFFYGTLGFILLLLGYKAFDKISPIDFVVEIKDEHNVAAAILAGSMMIGLGIIIASAIA